MIQHCAYLKRSNRQIYIDIKVNNIKFDMKSILKSLIFILKILLELRTTIYANSKRCNGTNILFDQKNRQQQQKLDVLLRLTCQMMCMQLSVLSSPSIANQISLIVHFYPSSFRFCLFHLQRMLWVCSKSENG